MAWRRSKSGNSRVAWLALIVALAALALAWSAFRRTGGELGGLVEDFTRDAERRIRGEETARVEVGRELEEARRRWEALDAELKRLEGRLGEGGADARRGLDSALEEVRTRLDEARGLLEESAPEPAEPAKPERPPE